MRLLSEAKRCIKCMFVQHRAMQHHVTVLKHSVFFLHIFLISTFALDTLGYIVHDIFEGILPVEFTHCLKLFILNKYLTLDYLNESILKFPFKFADRCNRPHAIVRTFMVNKSIGGRAHENWNLL